MANLRKNFVGCSKWLWASRIGSIATLLTLPLRREGAQREFALGGHTLVGRR